MNGASSESETRRYLLSSISDETCPVFSRSDDASQTLSSRSVLLVDCCPTGDLGFMTY
jgi:hypothetical protein